MVLSLMRGKLGGFYSAVNSSVLHWNLFVLEVKLFNRLGRPHKKTRCDFHLTIISKIRSYLDRDSTEAIIHAFVTTNLDNCNATLFGLPKVLLSRLQLVQNRAARIVTFTKKYEHITPSLMALHWLPVDYQIIYKILLLVYTAINGFSPSYISDLLSFCSSSYSLYSCLNKLLQVPRSNLKSYVDRDFPIAGPKLWNSLPASLRNAESLNSFKKHLLKTFLFHQAFS